MLAPLLRKTLVDVKDDELTAMVWSFLYFFAVMASLFVIRPLRDEMGVASGARNLPWLFTATFVSMLVLIPIYGYVTTHFRRQRFVPFVYHFIALNLVGFVILWRLGVSPVWTGRVFFVWTSVYNLFVVSVLWSVLADAWRSEQGKRLFGFIAMGGSIGAALGPLLTAGLVGVLGPANLVLVAALLLELAVFCIWRLYRHAARTGGGDDPRDEKPIGGGILRGLINVLASPYLRAIAISVALYTITSTFIYLRQAHIFETLLPDRVERTRIFAMQDFAVNVVTIVFQAGLTGRIMARLGLVVALAAMPAVTMLGFAAVLIAPTVAVAAVFYAVRRAVHFALERPAREVLFTAVSREDRFKTKNVIDTVIYRGGDFVAGLAFTALGVAAVPVAIPLSAAWIGLSIYLVRRHEARQGASP